MSKLPTLTWSVNKLPPRRGDQVQLDPDLGEVVLGDLAELPGGLSES